MDVLVEVLRKLPVTHLVQLHTPNDNKNLPTDDFWCVHVATTTVAVSIPCSQGGARPVNNIPPSICGASAADTPPRCVGCHQYCYCY